MLKLKQTRYLMLFLIMSKSFAPAASAAAPRKAPYIILGAIGFIAINWGLLTLIDSLAFSKFTPYNPLVGIQYKFIGPYPRIRKTSTVLSAGIISYITVRVILYLIRPVVPVVPVAPVQTQQPVQQPVQQPPAPQQPVAPVAPVAPVTISLASKAVLFKDYKEYLLLFIEYLNGDKYTKSANNALIQETISQDDKDVLKNV